MNDPTVEDSEEHAGASDRYAVDVAIERNMKASDVGSLSITALIEQIHSDAISPGAGTAAAVVLALASACAGKAIAVTLKKGTKDALLTRAQSTLTRIRHDALSEGRQDAVLFEESVREDDPEARRQLIGSGDHLTALEEDLLAVLDEIGPRVAATVFSDVKAARQLCAAAMVVHRDNLEQSRDET